MKMATETIKKTSETLLQEVFRNVRMASDSLLNILPKVHDDAFRSELTVQISAYEAFASRTVKLMEQEGVKPTDENTIAKLSAKMGIFWNTVKDPSLPHLAQMILEGTTMGIGETLRAIHNAETDGASEDVLRLARDVNSYQEKIAEDMKKYLC